MIAAASAADDARAEAVRIEGIRLQYESMPNAYIASGVMATVVVVIFQQTVAPAIWGAWLGAVYLPVYYAFFIPPTLPGIAMFLMQSDQLRVMTGIAYLCFMAMVTRFAHVLHRSFIVSTRLRFENTELVEALRTEKAAAEEANLVKSRFLAAASHDLRQPMHALSLFIDSLSGSLHPLEAQPHTQWFPTHDANAPVAVPVSPS